MSHADPGPLASYNSLQDKNLAGYFSTTRMKKHLVRSGLVSKKGSIVDDKTYRLSVAKKEHRKHVRDLLATAIVHKALDMERLRQFEIRKRLDDVYKVELVRRVRDERRRKGDEEILPLLSPRERVKKQKKIKKRDDRPSTAPVGSSISPEGSLTHHDQESNGDQVPSPVVYQVSSKKVRTKDQSSASGPSYLKDEGDMTGTKPYLKQYPNTFPVPAPPQDRQAHNFRRIRPRRFHYLARTEPAVAHKIQLQSMCEVTMKFLGPSVMLTNSLFTEERLSEVMVLQQHCRGSTLCIFRELLPPNTVFTFISRRHRGAPLGLTFYIDGMQDVRLSTCCEYKHKPGCILGGKSGHFQFVQVEGAAPCYRCQVASAIWGSKGKSKEEGEKSQQDKTTAEPHRSESDNKGETFDVIITRVETGDETSDSDVVGEKIDCSTQTTHYMGTQRITPAMSTKSSAASSPKPEYVSKEDYEDESSERTTDELTESDEEGGSDYREDSEREEDKLSQDKESDREESRSVYSEEEERKSAEMLDDSIKEEKEENDSEYGKDVEHGEYEKPKDKESDSNESRTSYHEEERKTGEQTEESNKEEKEGSPTGYGDDLSEGEEKKSLDTESEKGERKTDEPLEESKMEKKEEEDVSYGEDFEQEGDKRSPDRESERGESKTDEHFDKNSNASKEEEDASYGEDFEQEEENEPQNNKIDEAKRMADIDVEKESVEKLEEKEDADVDYGEDFEQEEDKESEESGDGKKELADTDETERDPESRDEEKSPISSPPSQEDENQDREDDTEVVADVATPEGVKEKAEKQEEDQVS